MKATGNTYRPRGREDKKNDKSKNPTSASTLSPDRATSVPSASVPGSGSGSGSESSTSKPNSRNGDDDNHDHDPDPDTDTDALGTDVARSGDNVDADVGLLLLS